ncbi:MAG: selenide, water dikinase SelD [Bacteroidales bacterium]|nr:selenide, water dikinase SelD [Bacteroidales bacterium]
MDPIYLDYNATTPLDPLVSSAMKPFLDGLFGNPSSIHEYGRIAAQAVVQARNQVASMLHCHPDEIVFTGGGTESNNYAIKGAAFAGKNRGNHLIVSAVEHPAVAEVCRYLEGEGFEITTVGVDAFGIVDPEEIRRVIRNGTILISVMHANNETGSIQPIAAISRIARESGVLFHTDAAQSIGKIPVDVDDLGVDLLSVAGHKLYAPKGIGALYIRRGVRLTTLLHGADHETNRRAGTENVLGIVGLGRAAEIVASEQLAVCSELHGTTAPRHHSDLMLLRDLLQYGIREAIPEVRLNGHPDLRLPNTLSLGFPGVEANLLLQAMPEIAASAGAACHSGEKGASGVLVAMKVPVEYAMGTIRFSVGRMTTEEEILRAVPIIVKAYESMTPPRPSPLRGGRRSLSDSLPDRTPGSRIQDSIIQSFSHPVIQSSGDLSASIRLTEYTHSLGCACKIRPQLLEELLKQLPSITDPKVLIGHETSEDAAVYLLNETQALIQTVDVIPPMVDDPYSYGAIAAANAISDIYAMGAKPIYALTIVGFPDTRLPMGVLQEVLRGVSDKAAEAGIQIVGGHSIELTEPLIGLSVTGVAEPERVIRNRGAKPGDRLILTKPIGTGILTTALKRGFLGQEETRKLIACMSDLNRQAAEVMERFTIHSCTDVTGFGLLGHLREMVTGEKVNARINPMTIPVLAGAEEMAAQGIIPGGTKNNLEYVEADVIWGAGISDLEKLLLCDAQTSGGLLIAVPAEEAEALLSTLNESGVEQASLIGDFIPGEGKLIILKERL